MTDRDLPRPIRMRPPGRHAVSLVVLFMTLALILIFVPDVLLVIFAGLLFGVFFSGGGDWIARHTGVARGWGIGAFCVGDHPGAGRSVPRFRTGRGGAGQPVARRGARGI